MDVYEDMSTSHSRAGLGRDDSVVDTTAAGTWRVEAKHLEEDRGTLAEEPGGFLK